MGSIWHIHSNVKLWKVYKTDKKLKEEYGGEELLRICYGSLDDDPVGICDLEMFMRQSVFQKVIEGEYKISPESKWKHRLILINSAGDEIPPVNTICY